MAKYLNFYLPNLNLKCFYCVCFFRQFQVLEFQAGSPCWAQGVSSEKCKARFCSVQAESVRMQWWRARGERVLCELGERKAHVRKTGKEGC